MSVVQMLFTDPFKLALVWSILGLGVFLSYRVLDVPDLSIEGVFPVAAAITIISINNGINPWVAILLAMVFGAVMGILTSSLNVFLKIPFLLSGIIVMTGLLSIAVVLTTGSISIAKDASTIFASLNSFFASITSKYWGNFFGTALLLSIIAVVIFIGIYWFFGTELGLAVRATGKNKTMSSAEGINNSLMSLLGMAISSMLIALAGSLYAQMENYASSDMGKGTLVLGLAILFLGEIVLRKASFKAHIISIFLGGYLYWLILGSIERIPSFDARYLYLVQAVMMMLVMGVPYLVKVIREKIQEKKRARTHA
jgi:putative tryptophan/tyrosine transport system permease protein